MAGPTGMWRRNLGWAEGPCGGFYISALEAGKMGHLSGA